MKNQFLFLLLLCFAYEAMAQDPITQNIKGQVTDSETGIPLIGANITILGSDPLIGAGTDVEGYFILPKLEIGRYSLVCSYLGYGEKTVANILLTSGKELVVDFALVEYVLVGEEVVVTATQEQNAKVSELATISIQEFNSEAAARYAGSRNDVSRMAAGFAGVVANEDSRNDIVIRGNSPSGLLWRLDGMDIPNPSHFGALGATGGPVSMLNNNLLDNSTFLTGAFPATYGNALSGVFDLQVRKGNKDKFEGMGQVSFNGFELGLEGPFSKKSNASYLINYRYSVLGLINKIVNTGNATGTGDAIPNYEDLNFKINVPTTKAGTFTLLGLAGRSDIAFLSKIEDSENPSLYSGSRENLYYRTNMGLIALTNKHYYNNHAYGKASLSLTSSGNETEQDEINDALEVIPFYRDNSNVDRARLAYDYKNKLNTRHSFNLGMSLNRFAFDFQDSVRLGIMEEDFRIRRSFKGTAFLSQVYSQWQYRYNDKLTMNLGVFAQWFSLNDTYAVEPRFNLKYDISPRVKWTFGAGRHSKLQDFQLYLIQTKVNGAAVETNNDLEMTRSDQLMTGFEWAFLPGWNLKSEAYLQSLSKAPVETQASTYSALNEGADFSVPSRDSLVNEGTGTNYGLELTLEKSFQKGFYLLSTVSLFDSKYVASDGVERNTAFNGGYVANVLMGKEFKISKKFSIALDTKITGAGGRRITPIDLEASIAAGEEVRDTENIFGDQLPDYFRTDVKITLRLNLKRTTQEWSVDLQNTFNNKNLFTQSYDERNEVIQNTYQLGRFPVFNYRITF